MLQIRDRLARLSRGEALPLVIILVVILSFASYCCLISEPPQAHLASSGITVQVLLATASPGEALRFSVEGPYKVFEGSKPRPYSSSGHLMYGYRLGGGEVSFDAASGILLNGKAVHRDRMVIVPKEEGALKSGHTKYGGAFEIKAERNGSLRLFNNLDLEQYLSGVLF